MFTINTEDNVTTKVTFKYDKVEDVRTTECIIAVYKDKELVKVIGKGIAYCGDKDRFNRSTGRKLSLSRALKYAGISKEDRKKFFWDKYFETIGKVK